MGTGLWLPKRISKVSKPDWTVFWGDNGAPVGAFVPEHAVIARRVGVSGPPPARGRRCLLGTAGRGGPPLKPPNVRDQESVERCPLTAPLAAKVAKLARIRVEEADLPALADEFNGGFWASSSSLQELDVDAVEPMTSVTPMRLTRRADVVTDGSQQDKVLSEPAPDGRARGFFAVPKVVE